MNLKKLCDSIAAYEDTKHFVAQNTTREDEFRDSGTGWQFLSLGAKCIFKPGKFLEGHFIYDLNFKGIYALKAKAIVLDLDELKNAMNYDDVSSFLRSERIGKKGDDFDELGVDRLEEISREFPYIVDSSWNVKIGEKKKIQGAGKICFLCSIDTDILSGNFVKIAETFFEDPVDTVILADQIRYAVIFTFVKRLAQIYDAVYIFDWFSDDTSIYNREYEYNLQGTNSRLTINNLYANTDEASYNANIIKTNGVGLAVFTDDISKKTRTANGYSKLPFSLDDEDSLSDLDEINNLGFMTFGNLRSGKCFTFCFSRRSYICSPYYGESLVCKTNSLVEAINVHEDFCRILKKTKRKKYAAEEDNGIL